MKKRLIVVLSTFLTLAGCSGSIATDNGINEQIDYSKTQLYVSNFNGGYGDTWLRDLKAKFEAKNKDISFEKDKLTGDNLLSSIPSSNNNVYFCESVFYFDYLNAKVMADIFGFTQLGSKII